MYARLDDIQKYYGAELILEHVNLQINEQDRIGLIGVNGAGKTTLLNILVKELKIDEGQVIHKAGLTIGYLRQNSGLQKHNCIWDEMKSVFKEVLEALKKLDEIAKLLKTDPHNLMLQKDYDRTLSFIEASDGYQIDVHIKKILNGMGFYQQDYDKEIDTLSGGEKTRLSLAKLLLMNPELLILDEPTNHLDLKTLAWLEEYLFAYSGAMIVVSHDRYFLDKVTNKTWELEEYTVVEYRGNYSSYKIQKAERIDYQMKEYKKQSRQIEHMKDYVQRNIARASTAKSAKSRIAQMANMEIIKKPMTYTKPPSFSFEFDRKTGNEVLSVDHLELAVGQEHKVLVRDISFDVRRGEKVAIIGNNGTGKTTLLKSLIKKIEQNCGDIEWGKNVDIGYYDQENKDMKENHTVISELQSRFSVMLDYDARSMLGRVLLTGEDIYKNVSSLSGGERAKLGFAILMAGRYNVLLLDEPTNHLDLAARESLEQALKEYEGTLLFVSHDRYFVNSLCNRVMEIEKEEFLDFSGGFEEYVQFKKRQEEKQSVLDGSVVQQNSEKPKGTPNRKEERRKQAASRQRISELEKKIELLEKEEKIVACEIEKNPTDFELLHEKCAQLEDIKKELETLTEEWLALV